MTPTQQMDPPLINFPVFTLTSRIYEPSLHLHPLGYTVHLDGIPICRRFCDSLLLKDVGTIGAPGRYSPSDSGTHTLLPRGGTSTGLSSSVVGSAVRAESIITMR
jgi:hypothetical protein